MLTAATLALVLQACAPTVNPQTQAALISVESGGNAFAILDDNNGRSYHPGNYQEAVVLADNLIKDGHRRFGSRDRGIDVGITQINSENFSRYGLTTGYALDPCVNLRTGSLILTSTYTAQYEILKDKRIDEESRRQIALSRTLQIYNSGSPTGDQSYVASIILAAEHANPATNLRRNSASSNPAAAKSKKNDRSHTHRNEETIFYQRSRTQRLLFSHYSQRVTSDVFLAPH